eukprot:6184765-Pleurochrysis_carterae.AAC.1
MNEQPRGFFLLTDPVGQIESKHGHYSPKSIRPPETSRDKRAALSQHSRQACSETATRRASNARMRLCAFRRVQLPIGRVPQREARPVLLHRDSRIVHACAAARTRSSASSEILAQILSSYEKFAALTALCSGRSTEHKLTSQVGGRPQTCARSNPQRNPSPKPALCA